MVIHFPVALLPMDIVFNILAIYLSNEMLLNVAYYCAVAGIIGGWIAILTGLLDLFLHLAKHGSQATKLALLHGSIQSSVVIGYTLIVSAEYKNASLITSPPTWLLGTKVVLVLALFLGNYIGGELLMKYIAKDFQSGNTTR